MCFSKSIEISKIKTFVLVFFFFFPIFQKHIIVIIVFSTFYYIIHQSLLYTIFNPLVQKISPAYSHAMILVFFPTLSLLHSCLQATGQWRPTLSLHPKRHPPSSRSVILIHPLTPKRKIKKKLLE